MSVSESQYVSERLAHQSYLKDVPEGVVELSEDLAEALRSEIYAEKANARMEERLAQLKEESEIVYTEE